MNNNFHVLLEQLDNNALLADNCWSGHEDAMNNRFDLLEQKHIKTVCFSMGDIEETIDLQKIPELFKLPFPVTWIEGFGVSPQFGRVKYGFWCTENDAGGINVQIYLMMPPDKTWKLCRDYWIEAIPGKDLFNFIPSPQNGSKKQDAVNIVGWLCAFLTALNCKNLRRVENKPDAALQKARKKRGKRPLFDTWTLEIQNFRRFNESNVSGGTHSSPRFHLRRGHAREYKKGEWCWVQPCAVGVERLGVINKDYSFKP